MEDIFLPKLQRLDIIRQLVQDWRKDMMVNNTMFQFSGDFLLPSIFKLAYISHEIVNCIHLNKIWILWDLQIITFCFKYILQNIPTAFVEY